MINETCETSAPARLVTNPLVSVLMITYNHAHYLAEAIEGVVTQQCDFPFELVIGEDASSDSTREVALAWQERYPDIIRVIHSSENVGMNANSLRIFERARGKYVAYCEGDDFWCARDKLARQVAIMESDSAIGIVHSDWARANQKGGAWNYDVRKSAHRRIAMRYLRGKVFRTWHFPKILRTCTILLRRQTMAEWYQSGLLDKNYPFGDAVLSAWVTSRWEVGYLPKVTAIYRVSPNSALRSGAKSRVAFYRAALQFDTVARDYFSEIPGYPAGYRWESAAGLLVWGWRAGDADAVRAALAEFKASFSLTECILLAIKSLAIRLPTRLRLGLAPNHNLK